jgi:hypothetical protein
VTRFEHMFAHVLPPRVYWASAFAAIVVSYLLCFAVEAAIRAAGEQPEDVFAFHHIVVLGCLAGYGFWRGFFHPAANPAYAAWLTTTPWTPEKPLPAGPVLLVWQDAVIVVILSCAAALTVQRWSTAILWLPLVFLGAYVLTLVMSNLQVGERRSLVVVAAAWLTLPLAIGRPGSEGSPLATPTLAAWGLAAVAYGGTVWGVRRAMRSFPWDDSDAGIATTILGVGAAPPLIVPPRIHWDAVDRLSPLGTSTVLTIAGLGGWLCFTTTECYVRLSPRPPDAPSASQVALVAAVVLSAARVARYVVGHVPPLSVIGRLKTARLINMGYDKVFLAPALAVLTAVVMPRTLELVGVPTPLIAAATAVVMLGCAFGIGPSLREWHLTGQFRMKLSPQRETRGRAEAASRPIR